MTGKLMWIGMILLVFGITLAASSSFNVYYWEIDPLGSLELPIAAKSSGYALLLLDRTTDMKKVEVHLSHGRLDILNETLRYGHLWNFTLTLSDSVVYMPYSQNVSITMNPESFPVTHVFDIPDNWRLLGKISVTNLEDFPVFVIVWSAIHRQLLNNNWQIAMNSGILSALIGIAFVGTEIRKRI